MNVYKVPTGCRYCKELEGVIERNGVALRGAYELILDKDAIINAMSVEISDNYNSCEDLRRKAGDGYLGQYDTPKKVIAKFTP